MSHDITEPSILIPRKIGDDPSNDSTASTRGYPGEHFPDHTAINDCLTKSWRQQTRPLGCPPREGSKPTASPSLQHERRLYIHVATRHNRPPERPTHEFRTNH